MSRRKGIALCYPYEESRLSKWMTTTNFIIAQPKLDGERCRAIIENKQARLLSSEGNEILSVPHINEELARFYRGPSVELDGELYVHGMDFPTIHSIVGRTANLHSDYAEMQLHLFDIIAPTLDQEHRLELLTRHHELPHVKIVPTMHITPDRIEELISRWTYDGYEGIILRHPRALYKRHLDKEYRSPYMMKFKPGRRDIYQITGVAEEISKDGTPKGMTGALYCTNPSDPDSGATFKVSCGATTHEKKREWWQKREELMGKYVVVSYQHLSKYRVPRHGRVNLETDLILNNMSPFNY